MTKQDIIDKMRQLEQVKKLIVQSQEFPFNEIVLDDELIEVSQECINDCMALMIEHLKKEGELLLKQFNELK